MKELEEWFTLEDIEVSESAEDLYCIGVNSPDKQFLAGEIGVPTHNTDEGKADDEMKGEASMIIGSIARLGRAAGVHLIIATQRPDATILPGETKANMGVRINCGRTDSNASNMILGTGDGARVKANPRGRLYLRIYGNGDHGQGFFASPTWIDEYLASKGLNPDGRPISSQRSRLANVTDMSQFEEGDLDAREGVDNSSVIEKIKQEEASGNYSETSGNSTEDDEDEVEFSWDDIEATDTSSVESPTEEPDLPDAGKLGRPELGGGGDGKNKFHRPEEDWTTDLEDLIRENNRED